ncbi:hypothetical protein BHE74_00010022 [Ensete ventricosum]|nr:hypothetical protein BHE74_00010022 [Ensete ventricosum]
METQTLTSLSSTCDGAEQMAEAEWSIRNPITRKRTTTLPSTREKVGAERDPRGRIRSMHAVCVPPPSSAIAGRKGVWSRHSMDKRKLHELPV